MAAGQIPNHVYQLAYQCALQDLFSHKLVHFQGQKPVHIQGFCTSGKRTDPGAHQHEFCGHCMTEYKRQVQVQVGNRGTVQIAGQSSNARGI